VDDNLTEVQIRAVQQQASNPVGWLPGVQINALLSISVALIEIRNELRLIHQALIRKEIQDGEDVAHGSELG
jgi:hypothetical protein